MSRTPARASGRSRASRAPGQAFPASGPPAASGLRLGWVVASLILAVAAIYAETARHLFVALDDDVYIVGNPIVARGLTWSGIAWAFTQTQAANWHPLTWISHMIDGGLFGVTDAVAGRHHLMSAALHALDAVLLFAALRSLTGHDRPSALVAALFAVHPLRVESVAWASERSTARLISAAPINSLSAASRMRSTRPSDARIL